jgi:hypothetical protein
VAEERNMSGKTWMGDTRVTTLEQAKQWLRERVKEGAECPCCTQFAKVYRRKLNSSMAYALILVDRFFRSNPTEQWLHVPSHLADLGLPGKTAAAIRGDWAKLLHWNMLIERQGESTSGTPHSGYYGITDVGRGFVGGKIRVPRFAYFYDSKCLRLDADIDTDIHEALGDKFDYAELMRVA